MTPTWCRELGTKINEHGSKLLDAPVLGSRPQAETCQLIHLKDFDYVEQLAQFVKSEIPTIAKSTEIYQQAKKAGYGNENISGVAQLYL